MAALALFLFVLARSILPAEASEGLLTVTTNVPNAEVFLDNERVGTAPYSDQVAPGVHVLRVVADNHDPWVRRITVTSGQATQASAVLTPGTGTVEWMGPPGARLEVDGVDRGMLPIRLGDLAPGPHRWVVTQARHEPATGSLEVVTGKNLLVAVSLMSSAGRVVIETVPAGARVWLDGEPAGATPLSLDGVAPGLHGFRISASGRATVFRAIDTSDGSRGELKLTLPFDGTPVRFPRLKEGGRVTVNGVPTGSLPANRTLLVERGRIRVGVEAGGRSPSEGTLDLQTTRTVVLAVHRDTVRETNPLTRRWGFWAAVGLGVAAGATGGVLYATAGSEEPPPEGDIVVELP